MQKLFNKILVPVDFTSQSKKAVERAVDIAKLYNCSIHLLHVVTISPFASVELAKGNMALSNYHINNKEVLEKSLKQMCEQIHLNSNNKLKVDYSLLKGSWDEVIIGLVNENKFDLVIIGQKVKILGKRNMVIGPDNIAARTNVPVITVPSNRRLTELFSIVIPITDFLPVKKLMYGVYMASTYSTTVKLLGIGNEQTKDKVQYYLKKSYQLIHDNCNVKVELETIVSENVADAVNQFASKHSADLLIVNPGTQTKMPGFFSALLGNVIQKYSTPPVLTVNPV